MVAKEGGQEGWRPYPMVFANLAWRRSRKDVAAPGRPQPGRTVPVQAEHHLPDEASGQHAQTVARSPATSPTRMSGRQCKILRKCRLRQNLIHPALIRAAEGKERCRSAKEVPTGRRDKFLAFPADIAGVQPAGRPDNGRLSLVGIARGYADVRNFHPIAQSRADIAARGSGTRS